jgi:hypothetical protein
MNVDKPRTEDFQSVSRSVGREKAIRAGEGQSIFSFRWWMHDGSILVESKENKMNIQATVEFGDHWLCPTDAGGRSTITIVTF